MFGIWFQQMNDTNNWIKIPDVLVSIPGLPWLPSGFVLNILIAIVFLIVSYGLMNIIFAFLFPIQPGKYDAPPLKPTGRRKRRR